MIFNSETRSFEQSRSYDVVVVGGGIAGVIAAASAAKTGAKTLMTETSDFLGGIVTMGPLEALMTQNDADRRVIGGVAQELLDELKAIDRKAENTEDATGYCGFIIPYDAESMKLAISRLLNRYQVDILLETTLEQVLTQAANITGVVLRTRVGVVRVSCKSAVDATGNGYCAYLAGNDLLSGDEEGGVNQPVTVLARIGGVDPQQLRAYVREHPGEFKTFSDKPGSEQPYLHLWGFSDVLKEGADTGALDLRRDEIHIMETTQPGEVVVNYSRINIDPFDPFAVSRAQLVGMEQVWQLYQWFRKKIPAFAHAQILQCGYVGVRESGRVKGRCVLTREMILQGHGNLPSVAMGSFPIDIHQPGNGMKFERVLHGYQIPGDCLRAEKIDNLFAAGRCVSSTFEANASCRISMTCMATGHAAGVMAGLYAKEKSAFSVQAAQKVLLEQGAVLE